MLSLASCLFHIIKVQSQASNLLSLLVAENALLRKPLIILRRQVKQPADQRRIAQAGHPCLQAHHPEVSERSSRTPATRSDLGDRSSAITPPRSGGATRFLVTDIFFRPLVAFFLIELRSRKVIHVGVTLSPTDAWVAESLREATPYGQAPKYLIRENDSKFGSCFARVATTSAIEILKTPVHAPRANAICERFLRSVRQACLDRLLIFHEKQHEPGAQCLYGLLQPGTTPSKKASRPATLWLSAVHAASKHLFCLPDGVFLSPSSEKNQVPCPSIRFRVKG